MTTKRCMWQGCDKVLRSNNKSGLCSYHYRLNYERKRAADKICKQVKKAMEYYRLK